MNAGFDRYALNYEVALDRGISVSGESKDFFARERIAWLAERLRERNVHIQTALDFGCGIGSATPYLTSLLGVKKLYGFDPSTESLERATQEFGSSANHYFANLENFPVGVCDLGFCNGVFHHIPVEQRAECVKRVYNAIKPGGNFAFFENNPYNLGTRYVMSRIPFDRDAIKVWPRQARRLLRESGFEIVLTDFLFVFPRMLKALRRVEPMLARWPIGAQYLVLARKPHD
jgi:SAM-dependent methyltransferase